MDCRPFNTDCIIIDGADAKRTKLVGGNRRPHSSKVAGGEPRGCRAIGAASSHPPSSAQDQ